MFYVKHDVALKQGPFSFDFGFAVILRTKTEVKRPRAERNQKQRLCKSGYYGPTDAAKMHSPNLLTGTGRHVQEFIADAWGMLQWLL